LFFSPWNYGGIRRQEETDYGLPAKESKPIAYAGRHNDNAITMNNMLFCKHEKRKRKQIAIFIKQNIASINILSIFAKQINSTNLITDK
jgi:hypothetical protein